MLAADPPDDAEPAGAAAAARPVPGQLPADLPDVAGRTGPLATLDALLPTGDTVPVAALPGRGGIGKTSLAVHAAHQARDRFPDGQLYVPLRGTSPRPAEPADVLADFLRALGVPPAGVPADADERAGLYRSLLAGRRVLVVLDD